MDMASFMTSYLLATEWNTSLTSDCFDSVGTCLNPKWLSATDCVYCAEEEEVELDAELDVDDDCDV